MPRAGRDAGRAGAALARPGAAAGLERSEPLRARGHGATQGQAGARCRRRARRGRAAGALPQRPHLDVRPGARGHGDRRRQSAGRRTRRRRALQPLRLGDGGRRRRGGIRRGGDPVNPIPVLSATEAAVWDSALDPKTDDAIDNRALARMDGVRETGREEPWPATAVMIDALLGTGAAGPARGDVLALAQRLVAYGAPVVAIDGPTGLDLSSGEAHGPVRAELSITFGGPRRGHLLAREWCGKIEVVDIGLPPADPVWPVLVTDAWAGARLPKLTPTMHKGDRGRVTVVGGAHGMTGAALHAARGALAAGAGLVQP